MAEIRKLIDELSTPDPAKAFGAKKDLTELATRATAPEKNEECRNVAMALADALVAKSGEGDKKKIAYPANTRNHICRLLGYLPDAAVVPALVEAMKDDDVREMARFALDRNTNEEAVQALAQALDSVGPDFRTGVVNALGRRSGATALDALKKAAEDEDPAVRIAAIEALANFPEPANDGIIRKAAKANCKMTQNRAQRARVRLAETLANAGKKDAAKKLYEAIKAGDAGNAQKNAADIGLKNMG